MVKVEEKYQRITDDRRSFDIQFWQSQGDIAIFEAVTKMPNDYLLIRGKNASEYRLQRTVEASSLDRAKRNQGNVLRPEP